VGGGASGWRSWGAGYGEKTTPASGTPNRVCSTEDCQTVLSRYDSSDGCSLHKARIPEPPPEATVRRGRPAS